MSIDKTNGIIVILSYPDTVVRPAYWEPSSKVWPLIGIGSKHGVQAGHAALLLIKKTKLKLIISILEGILQVTVMGVFDLKKQTQNLEFL
ncbi:hypothetical protein OEG92_06165 [Polaribacter sejongensis]